MTLTKSILERHWQGRRIDNYQEDMRIASDLRRFLPEDDVIRDMVVEFAESQSLQMVNAALGDPKHIAKELNKIVKEEGLSQQVDTDEIESILRDSAHVPLTSEVIDEETINVTSEIIRCWLNIVQLAWKRRKRDTDFLLLNDNLEPEIENSGRMKEIIKKSREALRVNTLISPDDIAVLYEEYRKKITEYLGTNTIPLPNELALCRNPENRFMIRVLLCVVIVASQTIRLPLFLPDHH